MTGKINPCSRPNTRASLSNQTKVEAELTDAQALRTFETHHAHWQTDTTFRTPYSFRNRLTVLPGELLHHPV
jgi:hypothetical protein